jgi:integrase/recombinase XerD
MLGRLRKIVGLGKSEKTRENVPKVCIINGVVLGESRELDRQELESPLCEIDIASQSENRGTSTGALDGVEEGIKHNVTGPLPAIEQFFVYLQATGRSPRTIRTYQYEYTFWKKKSHGQVYFLEISEIENLIKDLHPSTAKKKIALLRKLAKWYLRQGKSKLHLEVSKLEIPKQVKRLPADRGGNEFIKYRNLAQTWCQAGRREGVWLGLMLTAGLRISEIATVQIGHQNFIRVIGKGSKERLVPVSPWLIKAMHEQKGIKQGGWRLKRKRIWAELAKEGIMHPHSLRHTYASELLRRGKSIEEIKVLLGHESIATTNIYTKLVVPVDVPVLLDR